MLSENLRITLPTKPSHTTTSAAPSNTSRPSTLPTKCRRGSASSSAYDSRTRSLPLLFSSPMLSSPTRGRLDHRGGTRANTEPMMANWTRFLGVHSWLAPTSSTTAPRLLVGPQGRDRRARDAVEPADGEQRARHHGAGVARADHRVGASLADQAQRHGDGRILLAADRLRGRFVHVDVLGRVDDLDPAPDRRRRAAGEFLPRGPTRISSNSPGLVPGPRRSRRERRPPGPCRLPSRQRRSARTPLTVLLRCVRLRGRRRTRSSDTRCAASWAGRSASTW